MKTLKNSLIAFLLIFPFVMHAQEPIPAGVSVSGEGKIYVKPDIVHINIAIEHKGDYVKEIQKATQKDVDATLKFLKNAGIPEKNIQTQYIRLNEEYQYNQKTYTYSSSQGISVKIEDMNKYENIITGLMNSGVNRINNIYFESSEVEKYEAQARVKAIKDAKEKAKQYAEALGQSIGKAKSITDLSMPRIPVSYASMEFKQLNAAADAVSQQSIAPGEIEVTANVIVNFNLME